MRYIRCVMRLSTKPRKKAIVTTLTQQIFLGAVALVILTTIIMQNAPGKEDLENQRCRRSVAAAYAAKMTGQELIDEVKCPFRWKELDKPSKEKAEEVIAESMAVCWANFHRGSLDIFDAKNAKFCVPCSIIEIKDVDWEIEGKDFLSYLNSTNVPGMKTSYLAFLTNEEEGVFSKWLKEKTEETDFDFTIGKGKYFIMYTDSKWGYEQGMIRTAVGAASIGAGIGLIAGSIGGAATGALAGAIIGTVVEVTDLNRLTNDDKVRIPAISIIKYEDEEAVKKELGDKMGCRMPTKVS